ncbi:MAG: hypothetical protein HYT76_04595 [Deltaproteobacteria bacterium]|nr:hypothetical protein [Deltaproteobacteria bacterium]
MKHFIWPLITLLIGVGCNKVVVHGKDRPNPSVSRTYSASLDETFSASQKTLATLGYEISEANPSGGTIRTRWISTKATSHYTDVFGEKDYGVVGTYYRLEIALEEKGEKTSVAVSAPVRSLVHKQKSTYREEKKFLKKLADFLRKDQFDLTNIGASE